MRTIEVLREDWLIHGKKWHQPGFQSLALHRIANAADGLPGPLRAVVLALYWVLYFFTRNVYGVELPRSAKVGERVWLPHGAVVIGPAAEIGNDCIIRQFVTIGGARLGGPNPKVGNGVRIGAGAVVAGGITIGDGARIGPNAVVLTDVPPGGTAFAPAPRVAVGATAERTPRDSLAGGTRKAIGGPSDFIEFIRETLDLHADIDADTPLISSGLVDSLNLAVLLEAITERYEVDLAPEDVAADDFDTPGDMFWALETACSR